MKEEIKTTMLICGHGNHVFYEYKCDSQVLHTHRMDGDCKCDMKDKVMQRFKR